MSTTPARAQETDPVDLIRLVVADRAPATDIAPGDTVELALSVVNVAGQPLRTVVSGDGATATGSGSFTVEVQSCPTPFEQYADAVSAAPRWRCGTPATLVVPRRPLAGFELGTALPSVLGTGAVVNLLASYRLAPTAGNELENVDFDLLRLRVVAEPAAVPPSTTAPAPPPTSGAPASIPRTGTDPLGWALAGAGLVGLGLALATGVRARRQRRAAA